MTSDEVAMIGRAIKEIVAPLCARIAQLESCGEQGAHAITEVRRDIAITRERVAEVGGGMDVLKSARQERPLGAFDVSIEGRLLKITLDGQVKNLRLPIPMHLGKFEPGKEYEQADEVALHGCTWRANVDKPQGEPGASGDWLLVAKAGGAR